MVVAPIEVPLAAPEPLPELLLGANREFLSESKFERLSPSSEACSHKETITHTKDVDFVVNYNRTTEYLSSFESLSLFGPNRLAPKLDHIDR